jgi:hypothetical protein
MSRRAAGELQMNADVSDERVAVASCSQLEEVL